MARGPLRLFLTCAHEDHSAAVDLRIHLAPRQHEKIITIWFERDLIAGAG